MSETQESKSNGKGFESLNDLFKYVDQENEKEARKQGKYQPEYSKLELTIRRTYEGRYSLVHHIESINSGGSNSITVDTISRLKEEVCDRIDNMNRDIVFEYPAISFRQLEDSGFGQDSDFFKNRLFSSLTNKHVYEEKENYTYVNIMNTLRSENKDDIILILYHSDVGLGDDTIYHYYKINKDEYDVFKTWAAKNYDQLLFDVNCQSEFTNLVIQHRNKKIEKSEDPNITWNDLVEIGLKVVSESPLKTKKTRTILNAKD